MPVVAGRLVFIFLEFLEFMTFAQEVHLTSSLGSGNQRRSNDEMKNSVNKISVGCSFTCVSAVILCASCT